jgi:hypothetical protein
MRRTLILLALLAFLPGLLTVSAQEAPPPHDHTGHAGPPAAPRDYHGGHDHGDQAPGFAIAPPAGDAIDGMCFGANLTGAAEVPPNDSEATGTGVFVLSADHTRLTYHIAFSGLTGAETVQHIHEGAPGVAGPVVFNLEPGSPKTGTIALTEAQAGALMAGDYYVNIHSSTFGGGEIRGQILLAGGCFGATLTGSAEVPPNQSAGSGDGVFALSPDRSVLVYDIAFGDLTTSETVRHIHRAAPGVAGPVVFDLPAGSPKTGNVTLTPDDAADLLGGRLYVNIHSGTYPGGEIRGQIIPTGACFGAQLSGLNEVPANDSSAVGEGLFVLSPDGSFLAYRITFAGLTAAETVQHIHRQAPGVSGPVVFNLPPGSPKVGAVALSAEQRDDLLAGMYYVNIHSGTYPGGEIRGQIVATACTAALPITLRIAP